jgi:plastocyanin
MRIRNASLTHIPSAIVTGILAAFLLSVPFFSLSQNSQGNQASAQYASSKVYVSIVPGASTKSSDAFSPSPAQVSVGTTVVWTNNDGALHTVESGLNATPDGKFGVQSDGHTPILIAPGKTLTYVTTQAGTFPYFCSLHPAMVGTLQVKSPSIPHISVTTDKKSYSTGEPVTVYGNIGTTPTGEPLVIYVYNPDGASYRFDQVPVGSDGSFSYRLQVGGPLGITGQYRVVVQYSGVSVETSFYFNAAQTGPITWNTAQLNIGGKTYPINYYMTGGSLLSLTGDPKTSTITARLSANSDGHLKIQIPRSIADAKYTNGTDSDYVLFVDNVEDFADDDHGKDTRTLTIPFSAHSQQIDIVGTYLVAPSASSSISAFTNKSTYSVGESVTLTGTATNANTASYITITVINSKGAVFKVDQFHPNADGSFAYTFALSGTSAAAGDWSVSAEYNAFKSTTHFTVQDSTQGSLSFKITGSKMTDISGNPITTLHANSQVMVNLSATNTKSTQQSMVIILQIENSEGTTEFLSWQSSIVIGNQGMTSGFGWTPSNLGIYKISAFVWEGIGNPVPLADLYLSTISVVR